MGKEKFGFRRSVVKRAAWLAAWVTLLFACTSVQAGPITYIFTGTIDDGNFLPILTLLPTDPTPLKGGILTVSFVGDTNNVTSPGVPGGCDPSSFYFCSGELQKNTVTVSMNGDIILSDSMTPTMGGSSFRVFNSPSSAFIGFGEAGGTGTDPFPIPLAFITSNNKDLMNYDLTGDFPETTLPVFSPTSSTPPLVEKLVGGGTLTINQLDATFQAIETPQTVPEPGTLALLSLVFGAATLSLRRIRRSQMRL